MKDSDLMERLRWVVGHTVKYVVGSEPVPEGKLPLDSVNPLAPSNALSTTSWLSRMDSIQCKTPDLLRSLTRSTLRASEVLNLPPEKIEKLANTYKWIQASCEYNDKVFLVSSAYVDASVKDIPPDPNLPDTVEYMEKLISGHDGARAFYDEFVAQEEIREVLGSHSTLSLVDEQWVGVLRLMINGLTKIRKIIDFHNARIDFEKILKYYVRYRAELEK